MNSNKVGIKQYHPQAINESQFIEAITSAPACVTSNGSDNLNVNSLENPSKVNLNAPAAMHTQAVSEEVNPTMTALRVLLVENSEQDIQQLRHQLQRAGYEVILERVETAVQMSTLLNRQQWDVVLADYHLPAFHALEALQLIQARGLDIPFIIVSGHISEDDAIAAMKAGVHDYVMKDNLARLVPAIERELREAAHRRSRDEAESALRTSERQLRAVFDGARDAMLLVNDAGHYLDVNPAASRLFGLSNPELQGHHIADFLISRENLAQAWNTFRQKGVEQGDCRLLRSDGSTRDVEYSVTANLLAGVHLLVLHDVTERKQAEDQLLYHAFYDSLTGLSNRTWFLNCLGRSIRQAKRSPGYHFAVLLLDLDRYQVIKYSFGHLVGDQLLIATARRLGTCLSPKDIIARLGGDEFAILLADLQNVNDATHIADRLQQELRAPFHLNECELFSTTSIGIASSLQGFEQPEDFLRAADTAMHHAKQLGGARCAVFETAMHTRAVRLLQLETDLRRALERQELRLHYQPIVCLRTGSITGFEALVRWQHPLRGFVSPIEFISVAEDTGLIIPLGTWVMYEACRQLREWQLSLAQESSLPPAYLEQLTMSVNVSGVQFTQPGLMAQIDQILTETALNPFCLKLEITETALMEAAEPTTDLLLQLKERQIQVCIDDFGTGYSSLSRLQRLPIDTLKIDRIFVSRMSGSTTKTKVRKPASLNKNHPYLSSDLTSSLQLDLQLDSQNSSEAAPMEIVRTCIALAQNLGMDVIAEGVETAEQLDKLRSLECEYGQGYLFSKPVNAETAKSLLISKPQW